MSLNHGLFTKRGASTQPRHPSDYFGSQICLQASHKNHGVAKIEELEGRAPTQPSMVMVL